MSKSKGNYVGIAEAPGEMFGKVMSISDELMWRWYPLVSFLPAGEIEKLKREVAAGRNPRDAKVALAQEIVERFHSRADAERALADFEARFRGGALPDDMPEVAIATAGAGIAVANLAKQAGVVDSTSEALRMIAQRGLRVDGSVVEDKALRVAAGTTVVVQAGKRRFARVRVD
jgi:tyrosyl-tRNA synthetase